MNELTKRIIDDMNLPSKRYEKPYLILLCGYSGSGKSTVCKILSHYLEAYIVGGDYVRNILYSDEYKMTDINEINRITADVTLEEVKYLLSKGVSVVIDKSISSKESLAKFSFDGVEVILINLKSTDEENIKRLHLKMEGKNSSYDISAYGDVKSISHVCDNPEEIYYDIKARKVYDLTDFDYEIDTLCSFDEFVKRATDVALNILKR